MKFGLAGIGAAFLAKLPWTPKVEPVACKAGIHCSCQLHARPDLVNPYISPDYVEALKEAYGPSWAELDRMIDAAPLRGDEYFVMSERAANAFKDLGLPTLKVRYPNIRILKV